MSGSYRGAGRRGPFAAAGVPSKRPEASLRLRGGRVAGVRPGCGLRDGSTAAAGSPRRAPVPRGFAKRGAWRGSGFRLLRKLAGNRRGERGTKCACRVAQNVSVMSVRLRGFLPHQALPGAIKLGFKSGVRIGDDLQGSATVRGRNHSIAASLQVALRTPVERGVPRGFSGSRRVARSSLDSPEPPRPAG